MYRKHLFVLDHIYGSPFDGKDVALAPFLVYYVFYVFIRW